MKEIKFKRESIESVKAGIDVACNAIRSTIGPRGRNVFIDDTMQPIITNDGVSTANAITLEGMENLGVWLVKNTCGKTFDDVGDATTTTATLLQAIINESLIRPENPIKIRKSLKEASVKVIDQIIKDSKPIKDKQIADVATIAAESSSIGNLIAEVILKTGKKTPIYIEENPYSDKITYTVSDGFEVKYGFISAKSPVVELENNPIFVTDKKIDNLMGIKELLTIFDTKAISSPVIICPDIDEVAYKFFMKLNEKGAFNYIVIRAKGTELFDMASACGATVISSINGLDFKDIKAEHLGVAQKIVITNQKTLITSLPTMKKLEAIDKLKEQANATKNMVEKQMLTRRAEALAGGVAIIKVGAPTDTERTDLKLKILNAVNTTKTALDEGIVEGGGMMLYRASLKLKGHSVGEEILRKALKQPLRDIIENAGEDYSEITKKIKKGKGYNADTNKIEDLIKSGVVDSAKSTRCAFINALSSASELITVGVSICNKKDETTRK